MAECAVNDLPCGAHGECTGEPVTCECLYGWTNETGFTSSHGQTEYCFAWAALEWNVWFVVFLVGVLHAGTYARESSARVCGHPSRHTRRRPRAKTSCSKSIVNIASHIFLLCGSSQLSSQSELAMLGLDTTPTFLIFNHIACESALAILFLVRFAEYYDRMKRSRLHRIAPRRKPCINRSILTRATPLPFIICNILAFSSLQDIYVLKVVAMSLLCLLGALGILALYILIMPILLDLNEIVGTAKPASHTVQFDRVYMLHNRTRWLLLSGLALCLVVILVSLLPLLLPSLRAYMSIFVAITIILGKLPRVILAQKDSVFRLKAAKSAHLRLDLQYIKHQRINKNLDFSEMARENIRAVEDYVRVLRSGDFGNSDERHSTTADLLSSNLLYSNHE